MKYFGLSMALTYSLFFFTNLNPFLIVVLMGLFPFSVLLFFLSKEKQATSV
jgi:hypothetical protein